MADEAIIRRQLTDLKTTADALRVELQAEDDIGRGLMMAIAITQLKTMLLQNNCIQAIASIHGSALGYLTDETRDRRYSNDQVADFVVHCLLEGDPLWGGHVMMLAGKKYRTKAGWMRLLRAMKVTELDAKAAAPQEVVESRNQSGSLKASGKCAAYAQCKLNGQAYRVDLKPTPDGDYRVDVDGNGKDSAACRVQMRGKAEARALARLFQLITGIDSGEDDAPVIIETPPSNGWTLSPSLEGYMDQAIARVEQQPALAEPVTATAPAPDFLDEVAALQTKLSPEHARLLGDGHEDITEAMSEAKLREVWEKISEKRKEHKLDNRAFELLTRMKDARKGELASE
jgi:hypothetical protein